MILSYRTALPALLMLVSLPLGAARAQSFGLGGASSLPTPSVPSLPSAPSLPQPSLPGASSPVSQICNQQYAPVCAQRDGVNRTYVNDCLARAAGATLAYSGACSG